MSWAPGGVTAPRRLKAPGCCWPRDGHKLLWRFLGSSPRGWELVPWCPGDLGCFGLSHSCLRCLTAVSSDSSGLSLPVWHSPAPQFPLPHGGVDLGTQGALLLVWPGRVPPCTPSLLCTCNHAPRSELTPAPPPGCVCAPFVHPLLHLYARQLSWSPFPVRTHVCIHVHAPPALLHHPS